MPWACITSLIPPPPNNLLGIENSLIESKTHFVHVAEWSFRVWKRQNRLCSLWYTKDRVQFWMLRHMKSSMQVERQHHRKFSLLVVYLQGGTFQNLIISTCGPTWSSTFYHLNILLPHIYIFAPCKPGFSSLHLFREHFSQDSWRERIKEMSSGCCKYMALPTPLVVREDCKACP